MKIGSFDTDRAVLVVAEIGNNHEGSFELAAQMVREAARCGVRAVKFQTVRAAQLVRRSEADRFARLTRFELSQRQFAELSELAHELGLLFISTPLSLEAAVFLEPMVDAYKVASGDNDFFPLLEKMASTGKPVVVSTGVSDVSQVDAAVRFLREPMEIARPNQRPGAVALREQLSHAATRGQLAVDPVSGRDGSAARSATRTIRWGPKPPRWPSRPGRGSSKSTSRSTSTSPTFGTTNFLPTPRR